MNSLATRSILTPRNLARFWKPGEQWGHAIVLGPLLAVHEAHRVRRDMAPSEWAWMDAGVVAEGLEIIWNMTGRWKARRVVTVKRSRFDAQVKSVVPRVARALNRHGVTCLRDLAHLDTATYRRVVRVLHQAVAVVSSLRPTRRVEPVLGSKVLHHFFPSLVPVFDTAYIRRGVMRTTAYRSMVAKDHRWLVHQDEDSAGGRGLLQFHRYFAFCASEMATIDRRALTTLRHRFGRGFAALAPHALWERSDSLLWKLDAKIAEYCALGEAAREGLLKPS